MIKQVSILEAEYIAHSLVRELMDYGEPVGDFNTRYPGRLESCLAAPFTYVDGRYMYFRLTHRAAILFYSIIKNHPFENGNKRMAVTLTLVFMNVNHKWIDIPPEQLYELATSVANSSPAVRNEVVGIIKGIFTKYTIDA